MESIKTGFSPFDQDLGGLEQKRTFLLRGESGTGKTVFGLKYLLQGLENYEPGLLVTAEHPEDVVFYAKSLGFDLSESIRNNHLIILEYPLDIERFARPSLNYGMEEIIGELASYVEKNGARRLVIDTINPFYLFSSYISPSQFCRNLSRRLGKLGTTTLLLENKDAHGHHQGLSSALEPYLYGTFELTYTRKHSVRNFSIQKLKGKSPHCSEYPFEVRYGEGLATPAAAGEKEEPSDTEVRLPPSFSHQLSGELKRAQRFQQSLSVLVLSLSSLLEQDEESQQAEYLKEILRICRENSRESDTVARHSNAHLTAILPGTDREGTYRYAKKIRDSLPEHCHDLTIGIATYPVDAVEEDEIIRKALSEMARPHF